MTRNRNGTNAPEPSKSTETDTRTVEACPDCGHARGMRPHTTRGQHKARDPETYAETDYTCKQCGTYFNKHEVVERPAESHNKANALPDAAKILARDDITTFEEARQAARARADGGNGGDIQ